jgi:hypothetical protein
MIGTRWTARRPVSKGAIAWFVTAAVALGVGLGPGREFVAIWAAVALAPLLIGVAVWVSRPEGVEITVTEAGLECEAPVLGLVGYDRLEGIVVPRSEGIDGREEARPEGRYAIVVRTEDRDFVIPPWVDAQSSEVAGFLRSRMGASGSRRVHPDLKEYLDEQVATFGEDRVWSYRANPARLGHQGIRRVVAVCGALGVIGLAWCVAGALMEEDAAGVLIGCGIWCLIAAAVTLGVSRLGLRGRFGRIKGIEESSLVVGPAGLALIQGPLRGEMAWEELRGVKPAKRWRSATRVERVVPPLWLRLDGATIPIHDVYDRPLPDIESRIMGLWK